jgi:hypothetical protein
MRKSTFDKLMGSGLTLAACLGTGVLWQGTALACSEPNTGTNAGKVIPWGVSMDNPYFWEPNTNAPAGGTGGQTPAPGGTIDPGTVTTQQAVLLRFTAGDDRDADPNRDYFNHPHRAYTLVTVTDTAGRVVLSEKIPVWHYDAIDAGTLRKGDDFKRIEAVRLDALPAGKYSVVTQAVFMHPNGNDSNWGGSPLEGAPATSSFVVAPAPAGSTPPAGTAGPLADPQSGAVTGSGCSAAPTSQSQVGWLALGGLLFMFARAIRRNTSL